ncbi:MAG TPA: hypothetical protein VHJ99_09705 [Candidatus Dormibacteraeota bacterium]|nr:hypothetical protein [Candidatus Dormibacteraeota bacterium]
MSNKIDDTSAKLDQSSELRHEAVDPGVAANERLTALTGALLFVLLAAMGITVLRVRQLLPEHFLLGFLLIPPLVLKMASTGYRFVRYYSSNPSYRRAGPPRWPMRLLAPIVVLSTAVLFTTGLELWLFGLRFGSVWVVAHKLSFVLWLPAAGIHILWYLRRSAETAAEEFGSAAPPAALTRRGLVVGSLVAGAALALATQTYQSPFIFFQDAG